MRRPLNSKGFTIIELMIATMVFSVILLIASFALIQIGKVYYKGVTISRTQEVARTIVEEITQSIQFSGGQLNESLNSTGGNVNGFCVGSRRYSYLLGVKLDEAPNRHVLVADNFSCGAGTTTLTLSNSVAVNASVDAREFLPGDMRLSNMEVKKVPGTSDLYSVHVRVVAGDSDLLDFPNGTNAGCKGNSAGRQFCAVADITTVIHKRLN